MPEDFSAELRAEAKDDEKVMVRVDVSGVFTKDTGSFSVEFLVDRDDADVRAISRIALGKAGFKPEVPTDPLLDEKLLSVAKAVGSALQLYGPGSGRDLWNTLWDVMRTVDPSAAEFLAERDRLPPHLREDDEESDDG